MIHGILQDIITQDGMILGIVLIIITHGMVRLGAGVAIGDILTTMVGIMEDTITLTTQDHQPIVILDDLQDDTVVEAHLADTNLAEAHLADMTQVEVHLVDTIRVEEHQVDMNQVGEHQAAMIQVEVVHRAEAEIIQ